MKPNVLILNGGDAAEPLAEVERALAQALTKRACTVESLRLREMSIAPCVGCFGCWIKTPGVCVIDDEGRLVTRHMIQSDVTVFLTPVVFGGYSSELKSALDRSIGLISPLFERIHGETHHKKRYGKYPRLLGIGVQQDVNEEESAIFEALVRRNAINLHAPKIVTRVIDRDEAPRLIQDGIEPAVEEVLAG